MIVIKIELWPAGDPAKAEHLGTCVIANDVKATLKDRSLGDYDVILTKLGKSGEVPRSKWAFQAAAGAAWMRGRVEGFPRQTLGGFDLLYRALKSCVGFRNP